MNFRARWAPYFSCWSETHPFIDSLVVPSHFTCSLSFSPCSQDSKLVLQFSVGLVLPIFVGWVQCFEIIDMNNYFCFFESLNLKARDVFGEFINHEKHIIIINSLLYNWKSGYICWIINFLMFNQEKKCFHFFTQLH